jgi:predicted RNA binding protein YcfA (HicA-like mRNA interferase family)
MYKEKGLRMPISGKDLVKLFLKNGFTLVKGGGKGSHTKLKKRKLHCYRTRS